MLIDCDRCVAKDLACGGCVVHVFLRAHPAIVADAIAAGAELDEIDRMAIAALAEGGLLDGGGVIGQHDDVEPRRKAS